MDERYVDLWTRFRGQILVDKIFLQEVSYTRFRGRSLVDGFSGLSSSFS